MESTDLILYPFNQNMLLHDKILFYPRYKKFDDHGA
jgi:hypothetical protein